MEVRDYYRKNWKCRRARKRSKLSNDRVYISALAKKRAAAVEFFRRRGLVWKMRGLRGLCVFEEHLPFFVTSAPYDHLLPEIATAWFRRRATERTTGTRIIKLIAPCEHSRRLPSPVRSSFRKQRRLEYFPSSTRRRKCIRHFVSYEFPAIRFFFFFFKGTRSFLPFFFFFFQLPDRDSYLSFRVCTCHGRVLSRQSDRTSLEMYRLPLFLYALASPFVVRRSSLNIPTFGTHIDFSVLIGAKFSSQCSFMRRSNSSGVRFALKNIRIAVRATLREHWHRNQYNTKVTNFL